MKKKFVAIAAAATLVMAALAGCGSTSTTAESSAPAETTASEAASTEAASTEAASTEEASTEAASTEAATEEASTEAAAAEIPADLSGAYPGVTVTAEFTGSGAGIEAVTAGSVDIGNASRYLTDEEKAAGISENIVAIDGIAVVVDTANEVAGLTSDQLASIYKGEVSNWSEVGGADQPIVVVGREAGSGTRSAFEELLAIEDQCAYANELDSTGAVMAKVASTPGAIGYVSLDVLDDTVKTVAVDDVEPTVENIKGGTYALSRPFVMATKGEISEQSEAVQAIFTYLASDEGKALVESVGLITVD